VEPREIFDLIVKADEALKYATPDRAAARRRQAQGWLLAARREAEAIGNRPLVEQADRRLADLEDLSAGPDEGSGGPGPSASTES
jgi:hypothetical protein